MPTDNNEQLELVNQRTRLNVSNVLMSVTITTFLVTGFTMMYSTAFDREFSVWAVMMFALIASLIFTVLYNIKRSKENYLSVQLNLSLSTVSFSRV